MTTTSGDSRASGDSKVVSWRCETEKNDDCERPSASMNSEDTPIDAGSSKSVLPTSVLVDDHGFQTESNSACDVTFDNNTANLQTASGALCSIGCERIECDLDVAKRTEDEGIMCSASLEDDLVRNVGTDRFNREEIHSDFPENTDNASAVAEAEIQSAEAVVCLSESSARSKPQKFEDSCCELNNSTPIKSESKIHMLEVHCESVNVSNSTGNTDECRSDTYAERCVSMLTQGENCVVSAALFDTALQGSMDKVQKSGVCMSTTPSFLSCTEPVTEINDSISDFGENIKIVGQEKIALVQDSEVQICTDISEIVSVDSVLQGPSQGKTEDLKTSVLCEDVDSLKASRKHNSHLDGFEVDASEHCGIDSINVHCIAAESASTSVGDFDSRMELSQPSPTAFVPPVKHKSFLNGSLSDSSNSYVEVLSGAAEKLNKSEVGNSEEANFINPGNVLSRQKIVRNNISERKTEPVGDLRIESTEESSGTSVLEQRFSDKDLSVLRDDSNRVASSVSVSDIDSSVEACSVLEADSNWDGNRPVKVALKGEGYPVSCETVNSSLSDLEVSSTSDGPLSCSHRKLYSTCHYDRNLPFFETGCDVEDDFSRGNISQLEELPVIEPDNCFVDAKQFSSGSSSPSVTPSILSDISQVGHQHVSNSKLSLGMKSDPRETLLQDVSSSSKMSLQFEDQSPSEFDDVSKDQSVQTTNYSVKDKLGASISRPNSASRESICSYSDEAEIGHRPNIRVNLGPKSSHDLDIESVCLEDRSELQRQSPKASKTSGFCVDSLENQDQSFLACSSNNDDISPETLLTAMEPVAKISTSDELSLLNVSEGGNCIAKRLCIKGILDEDDAIHSTVTLADFSKAMPEVHDEESNVISSSETATTYAGEVAHSNKDMCMELSNGCDDNSGVEKFASELLSHDEVSSGALMQKGSCDSTEITKCSTVDIPAKPTEEVGGMDKDRSSYNGDGNIFESPDQICKSEISNKNSVDLSNADSICEGCASTKISDENTEQSTAFVENAEEVCKTAETTLDTNIKTLFSVLEANPNEEEIKTVSVIGSNQNAETFSERCMDPVKPEVSFNEFTYKDNDSYAKLLDGKDKGMTQLHGSSLSDTEQFNCRKAQHAEDSLEQKSQPREDPVLRCDRKDGAENEQTTTPEQLQEWQNEFCLVIDSEQQQNFITEKKYSLESLGICKVSPSSSIECNKDIRNSKIHEQHCEEDIECSTAGLRVECIELESGYNGEFEHIQNLIVSEGYKTIHPLEENMESTVIEDCESKLEIRQQYQLNEFQQQQQEQQQEQQPTPRQQQQEKQLCSVDTNQGAVDFLKAQENQEENREFEDENGEENGPKDITQCSEGKLVLGTKTDQEFIKDNVDHTDKSFDQEHKSCVEPDTGLIVQNAGNCQNRGEEQESNDSLDNEQLVESEDNKGVEQEDNEQFGIEICSKNQLDCYHKAELVVEEQDRVLLNEHERENSLEVQMEVGDISEQQLCNRKAQEELECQEKQREIVDCHNKEFLGEVESRIDHDVVHDKDYCNEIVKLEQNLAREADHKDDHICNVEQELEEEYNAEVKDGTKSILGLNEKSKANIIVQLPLEHLSIVELECGKHFDSKMEESDEARQEKMNEDNDQGCELMVHECQTDQALGNKEQKQNPGKPEDKLNMAIEKEQDGDQQNQNKEEELKNKYFQMVDDLEELCQNTGDELFKSNPDIHDQKEKFVVELERDLGEIKRCDEIIKNEDGTDKKDVGQGQKQSKKIGRKQKQNRKTCVSEENIHRTGQEKKSNEMVNEDKIRNKELVHEEELREKTAMLAMLDPVMLLWNERSEEKDDCCGNEPWIDSENVAKQEISKLEGSLIPDESSGPLYLSKQNAVANTEKENSPEESVSMTCSGNLNSIGSKVQEPESSVFRANCQAEIINDNHDLLTAVDMSCATEAGENLVADLKTGMCTGHQLSYLKDTVATGSSLRDLSCKGFSEDFEFEALSESPVDESTSCDFSMNLCIDFAESSASAVFAKNLSFKKPDCGADVRNEKTSETISKSTEYFDYKKPKSEKGRSETIADKNNFNIFQKNQTTRRDDTEAGNSDLALEPSSAENQLPDVDALDDTVKDLSLSKEARLSGECTAAFKKSRKKKKVNKMAEDVSSSKETLSENSDPLDCHRPLEPVALLQSVDLGKDATEKTITAAGKSDSLSNDGSSETASKRSYWEMLCYGNSTVSDPSLSSIRQLEECVKAISISLQNCISNNITTCGIDSLSNCFQDSNPGPRWTLSLDYKHHNGGQYLRSFPQKFDSLPDLKTKSKSLKNHRVTKCLNQEQGCDNLNKLPWIESRKGGRKKMAAQNNQSDPVVQSDLEIVSGKMESAKDFGRKRRRSKKNDVSFNSPCISTNVYSVMLEHDRGQSIDFATDLSKKTCKLSLEGCSPILQVPTDETPAERMSSTLSVSADVQSNQKKPRKRYNRSTKAKKLASGYSEVPEVKDLSANRAGSVSSEFNDMLLGVHTVTNNEIEINLGKQVIKEMLPQKLPKKTKMQKAEKFSPGFSDEGDDVLLIDLRENNVPKKKMRRNSKKESSEMTCPLSGVESHLELHFDEVNLPPDKPKRKRRASKKGKHNLETISQEVKCSLSGFLTGVQLPVDQSLVGGESAVMLGSQDLPPSFDKFRQEKAAEPLIAANSQPAFAEITNVSNTGKEEDSEEGSKPKHTISERVAVGDVACGKLKLSNGAQPDEVSCSKDAVIQDLNGGSPVASMNLKPFACPQCSYRAKKKGQLRKHLGVHRIYGCAHCDFACGTQEELDGHMLALHPSRCGRKLCRKCHVLFQMDSLDFHERDCTGEKRGWECRECGKKFKFVSAMRTHLKRWHSDRCVSKNENDEEEGEEKEAADSLAFSSSSCDKLQGDDGKSDDTEHCIQLTIASDSERPLSLTIVSSPMFLHEKPLGLPEENFSVPCSMHSSEQLSNLSRSPEDVTPTISDVNFQSCSGDSSRPVEVIKTQPGSEMAENSSDIPERSSCKSSSPITTEAEVVTPPGDPALQIDLKEDRLLCIPCNKYFKNRKTFTSHSLTKHGLRPDLPHRRRSSKVSSGIGLHPGDPEQLNQTDPDPEMCSKMSVDTPNVVFACFFEGCGRQFKKLERLHKHEEKHTAEKQYRCDWIGCRKAFLHLDNLQLHRQHHTAAKPFPCDQCSLGYWQKCSLKSHQLKAHGKACDGNAEVGSVRCTDAAENLEENCRQEVCKNADKIEDKTVVNAKELNIYEFCESEDDEELVKLSARPSSMGRCKATVVSKDNASESSLLGDTDDELSLSAKATGLKKPLKTYLKVKKPKSEEPAGGFELDGSFQGSNQLESVPGGLYKGDSKCAAEAEVESNFSAGHNQGKACKPVKGRKKFKAAAPAAERQTGLCGSQDVEKTETESFSKKRKYIAATVTEERIVIKAVLPGVRKLGKKKSKRSESKPLMGTSLEVPEELNSVVKKVKSGVLKTKSKKTRSKKTCLPLQGTALSELSSKQKTMATEVPRHNRGRSRSETKAAEAELYIQAEGDVQMPKRGKKRKAEAINNEAPKPKKQKCLYDRSKPAEVRGKKTRNKRRRRKEKKKRTISKRKDTGKINNKDKNAAMNCIDFEPSTGKLADDFMHSLTEDSSEGLRDSRDFKYKMNEEKLSIEKEEEGEEESEQLSRENIIEQNNETVAAVGQSDEETEDETDSYYTGNKYFPCYKTATQAAEAMSSEEGDASVEATERENVEDLISERGEEDQRCEDDSKEKEFEVDNRPEEYRNTEIEADNEGEFGEDNEVNKNENEDIVEEEEEEEEAEEEEEENRKEPRNTFLESTSDDGMEDVLRPSAPYPRCTDDDYSSLRFGDGEELRYQLNEQGTRHEMDENYCSFDRLMPNDYHLQRLPAKALVDESEMQPSLAVPVIVSQVQSCHEPYATTTTTSAAIVAKQPGVEDRDYSSVYSDSYDVTCRRYSGVEAMYRRQTTSPNENHSSDSHPGESQLLLNNSYSSHYPLLPDRTAHNSLQSLEGLASGDHQRSMSGTFYDDANSKTLAMQVGKSLAVGFGGSQPSATPTFEVPPAPFSVEQTSVERPQDFSYAAGGRSNSKFAHSQQCQDGLSAVPRPNPLASELASPGTAISRDFFGQYFQDPGHSLVGQDQQSQGFAGQQQKQQQQQQSGLSSLQRGNSEFFRCNTPALLPPSAPCSTVPEPALGMKHAQLAQPSPAAQIQHWSRSHDDRTRPWDPVSPMIGQSDNSQRNSYGSAVRPEYPLEAGGSLIQSARRMESSSFRGVSPSVLGQPDLYGVPGAYSIAYSPSTASVGYSRTLPASQKHLEEAYRHAAAAHISDYRTFSAQAHPAPLSDVYGTMGINSTLSEFDRYYYSARDAMYRSQQLASAVPHPFMQQSTTTPQMAMSYADRTTYGRESAYGQPSPYGFMCDKQYFSPANSGGGKAVQGSSTTSDYLHVPVDQQDPYRRSVIYNMMPRYF